MALVRWEPFREIESLQQEMNRLFDTVSNGNDLTHRDRSPFMPSAELRETDDAFHLRVEVPGMEAKDLDVQVTIDSVTISGERRSETKTEEQGMTRSEFRYGKFHRTIPLPAQIQNNSVQANYEHGILTLNLPKAEDERNKVVKVNVA
jgi:HSP20 family protein